MAVVDWSTLDDDADATLDAQRDAMVVAQPAGRLERERYLAVDTRPAREVRFSNGSGMFVARQIFDRAATRTFAVLTGGTSERKVELEGRPGREIEMATVNDVAISRFFFDASRNRLYTLMVVDRRPRVERGAVAAFFDSFQFVEAGKK